MKPQSDASVNTPYNRMAFRKAATHYGAGYHHPNARMVREMIYTLAALAPFAVGMATKDPDKRFMTLRSIAVAESVALLAYEVFTQHQQSQGQGDECPGESRRPPQFKSHYQAMADATQNTTGRGMRR